MSYYDSASLVFIPSGYKTSKAYSVKPTDGSGDLAFTRSNDTATRVNSAGLIEKVRTNLILQSNTFSNASWTKTDSTVTSGQAGYDGTNNAWLLSKSASAGRITQDINTSGLKTFSLYAKAGTANWIAITFTQAESFSYFNISNGTLGTAFGTDIIARTITSVGSGWYRISISVNNTSTNNNIYVADSDGAVSGTSGNILIQASQIEGGDIATPYIATTSAAVSVGPVANVPRLDYLNSSCPRLLLEPQRTNSATYSEQINNTAWSKLNVTVSQNQAVGPDGTTSADLVYPTTNGADRLIEQIILATVGQTWTSSFFVKASGFSWVLIYAPNLGACWFNASTGVFGTIAAGVTATVLGQVNGYWRISFTGTLASSNAYFYAGPADANGTITATANGTNGLLFWGCQLEQGAYATSYIPTLGAAVTRGADAASKTGISSLIGQTEGTLFAEINVPSIASAGAYANFALNDGTSSNLVDFTYYPDGRIQAVAIVGGSITVNINLTSYGLTAGNHKIAFAYKLNDYVLYVDGTQAGADTSSAVPAMSKFDLYLGSGSTQVYNQAILFPTRLSNADLAALTA